MPGRPAVTGVRRSIPVPKPCPMRGLLTRTATTYRNRVRPKSLSVCNSYGMQHLRWPKVSETPSKRYQTRSPRVNAEQTLFWLPRPVSELGLRDEPLGVSNRDL